MLAQTDFLFRAVRPSGTYMPMHRHNCCELVYYITGTGLTCLEHLEYRYAPNTYTIIPSGMPHDERRREETDVLFVGFSLTSRDLSALQPGLFRDATGSPVLGLLLDMKEELHEKRAYYAEKLNMKISEALIRHMRLSASGAVERPDDSLLYARSFMDEHFCQKISIEDLAAMVGYSYHHFRHLFKHKFGVSPIRYLIDQRLDKARGLLRHTELPVTSVALECGFSNDAQFCTIFKRETGETPLAFRRNPSGGLAETGVSG